MTPLIAMYIIFRKNINKITAGLVQDAAPNKYEWIVATWIIATRCGVESKVLVGAFAAMSPKLVMKTDVGNDYILGFKPMKMEYTEHGCDVVEEMAKNSNEVIDLDMLLDRVYTLYRRNV